MAPLDARLTHLAGVFRERALAKNDAFLMDHSASLDEFAWQVRHEYERKRRATTWAVETVHGIDYMDACDAAQARQKYLAAHPADARSPEPVEILSVAPRTHLWWFYAIDADRPWGWSGHVFTLGFVRYGIGETTSTAWANARKRGRVPALLKLGTELLALPDGVGERITVSP